MDFPPSPGLPKDQNGRTKSLDGYRPEAVRSAGPSNSVVPATERRDVARNRYVKALALNRKRIMVFSTSSSNRPGSAPRPAK
jgi:hypothetical protein